MYEQVFNLNARPFTSAPYVKNYFPGQSIHDALTQTRICIERVSGPAVVIGATGTGKSLLLALLEQQYFNQLTVVNLSCAKLSERKELLQTVLFELGLPFRDMSEAELRLSLIEFLKSPERCPNGILLLIDEAHTLPAGALDEVQLMTNFVRNGESQVRLVMVGNHGLDDHLVDTRLESLNQRIACRCYLETMTSEETQKYITAHIARAGGSVAELFSNTATDTVHSRSGGCARLINQICDQAMVVAASIGSKQITDEIVEQAWSDIQCVPGTLDYTPNTTDALGAWQSVTSEESSIEVSTQFSDGSFGQEDELNPSELNQFGGSADESFVEISVAEQTLSLQNESNSNPDGGDSWAVFEVEPRDEQPQTDEFPIQEEAPVEQGFHATADLATPINALQSMETFVNPFDEPFVQEEAIVNDFVPQVAEQNLSSLHVSTAELNVLEELASERENSEANIDKPNEHREEIVVSDDSDLRLNPDELAKVEAIEREIERIENQAQAEQEILRVIPTGPDLEEPEGLAVQPIQIRPIVPVSQPAPPTPQNVENFPVEYSLGQTPDGQTETQDDKDMLIVSRGEQYLRAQIEDTGALPSVDPTQPSMPSTGSVTRMEYQELFEQLRKND